MIDSPRFVRGELPLEPYWTATIRAEPPALMVLHEPLLYVENEAGDTVASDEGTDLQIRLLEDEGDSARYELRWFNPALGADQRHRLILRSRDDIPALVSDWF